MSRVRCCGVLLLLACPGWADVPVASLSDRAVLHVEPVGRELYVAPDGTLWHWDRMPTDPHAPAGLAPRSVWPGPTQEDHAEQFLGVSCDGARWFWHAADDKASLRRVGPDGEVAETPLSERMRPHYWKKPDRSPGPLHGTPLLAQPGRVWCPDYAAMVLWTKDGFRRIPFPQPADEKDADYFAFRGNGAYFRDSLYADGEGVWLIRSSHTNTRTYRSYLLYVSPHGAQIVWATPEKQYITGMLRRGRERYLLICRVPDDAPTPNVEPDEPVSIARVRWPPAVQKQTEADIARRIADLDADTYATRHEADEILRRLPPGQAPRLERAMKEATSPEVRNRLRDILRQITRRPFEVDADVELAGCRAARMLHVDARGRAYAEAFADGRPTGRLLIADGKAVRSMAMPGPGFALGAPGPGGTVYAHDAKRIYLLDPAAATLKPVLDRSAFGLWGPGVYHALPDGRLCLAGRLPSSYGRRMRLAIWIDPTRASSLPAMPGKPLAEGVDPAMRNTTGARSCAAGPGGTFWFLKRTAKRSVRLYRVRDGRVEARGPAATMDDDEGAVWPLSDETALVVNADTWRGEPAVMMVRGDDATTYDRLRSCVEANAEMLLECLPPAGGFQGSFEYYAPVRLIRVGDGLFVQEEFFADYSSGRTTGGGSYTASGVYRDGAWVDWTAETPGVGRRNPGDGRLLSRLVAVDADRGSLIGFGPDWDRLITLPVASAAPPSKLMGQKGFGWAYAWISLAGAPRYTGMCSASPQAADRLHAREEAREPRREADYTDFRYWHAGRWRPIPFSLYNGQAYLFDGMLLDYRVGEVLSLFENGQVQRIPTGGAGYEDTSIARQDADTIWINDVQSFRRLRAVRNAETGKVVRWKQTHRYGLGPQGFAAVGPWFAGNTGYYVCNGTLYAFTPPAGRSGRLNDAPVKSEESR